MNLTPLDRTLNASLVVAPVLALIADLLYAVRGWDDPAAAVLHILGAAGYTVVVLRLVTLGSDRLAAALLLIGALGAAGNVAYGFNTIHVSLGDTDLVDAAGAATIIKPLGLFFPLTLVLAAAVLRRVGPRWVAPLLLAAGLVWPVAHIADIGWLAVACNVALVAAFGAAAGSRFRTLPPAGDGPRWFRNRPGRPAVHLRER